MEETKSDRFTRNRVTWLITKQQSESCVILIGPAVLAEIFVQPIGGNVVISLFDAVTALTGKRLPPNNYTIALAAGVWSLDFGVGIELVNGLYVLVTPVSKVKYWVKYDQ